MAHFCTLGAHRKSNSSGNPSTRWGSRMGYVPEFSECKAWRSNMFPEVYESLEEECDTWETPNSHAVGGSWMGFEARDSERNQGMRASGMIYAPKLFTAIALDTKGCGSRSLPLLWALAVTQQDHGHGHWGHMAALVSTLPARTTGGFVSFTLLSQLRASWSGTCTASPS